MIITCTYLNYLYLRGKKCLVNISHLQLLNSFEQCRWKHLQQHMLKHIQGSLTWFLKEKMQWNHTLYSDVDCIAELSWSRLTPVRCPSMPVTVQAALGSGHRPPVGTGGQVWRGRVLRNPPHSPPWGVSFTVQWDGAGGEVLHSVRTHCEGRWRMGIWKTACHNVSNRAQRSSH